MTTFILFQKSKNMKKTITKTPFIGHNVKPQDVLKSLNQNYTIRAKESALYFLPTYPDFAHTPVMQTIAVENDLFGVFETIFHFKQAFTQKFPNKKDLTILKITLLKKATGDFSLLIYWNTVFIHEIELGARKFKFNYFDMCLYDNTRERTKHILLLPEELADQNHFINS